MTVEIDETGEVMIDIPDDIYDAFELYSKSPIFQKFIDDELSTRQTEILGMEESHTGQYSVKGFILDILGQEFKINAEDYIGQ